MWKLVTDTGRAGLHTMSQIFVTKSAQIVSSGVTKLNQLRTQTLMLNGRQPLRNQIKSCMGLPLSRKQKGFSIPASILDAS